MEALGVDEQVWPHTRLPGTGMVTGIADHTIDAQGIMHARLLDIVEGRSKNAYTAWLKDQSTGFAARMKTTALDPFRGHTNAIRDKAPPNKV